MDLHNFLSGTFIFKGLSETEIENLLSEVSICTQKYKRSDIVCSRDSIDKRIGFVLSGKCEILRQRLDGSSLSLNTLEPRACFGVLSVFSESEVPTEIRAVRDSEILFLSRDDIYALIAKNPTVSFNIIGFLADRISFLNKKIATFTCSKAEDKLACFLTSEYAIQKTLSFPFNCQKTASALNMGRASLYRALQSLSDSGLIDYDTKKITIKNLHELERITK